jgi:hypothetical protein
MEGREKVTQANPVNEAAIFIVCEGKERKMGQQTETMGSRGC